MHCCFCLKLLRVCWFMLRWYVCNIPDSNVSEYSTTDISNFGVDKYYIVKTMDDIHDSRVSE